ncbi:lipopolysaccharide biosynthesis protein [Vibrio kagoshimensis]|uniref:lipopolysaccharide biosynthesis protein n=1 Tax=Vibrio kagoshimensis TaxID=2910244 RepID=UPI003D24BC0A
MSLRTSATSSTTNAMSLKEITISQKQSPVANMLIYGLGLVLNKGISLIMLPLMASYLQPQQIGKLDLLASIGAASGIVIALAMHEVLYRFVGTEKQPSNQFKRASELYSSTCMIAVVISLVLFSIINITPFPTDFLVSQFELNLLLVCASLEGVLGLSTAWLRMQDKAKTFLMVSVLSTTLQVGLIVVVLSTQPTVVNILACGAIAYGVQFLSLHFINRFEWRLPSKSHFKNHLSYGVPLMLTAFVGFGLNGSERFFLAYNTDLSTLGLYAVAIKFSFAMCILMQPFGMWWMPKRFQYINEHGIKKTCLVTQLGISYLTALTIFVAFSAKVFISLALPESYVISTQLLVGTLLVAWFKELAELVNIGVLYNKNTQQQFRVSFASTLIGLGLMWGLGSELGIWGIIIALGAAQALKAVLIYCLSQRQLFMPYQLKLLTVNITSLFIFLYIAFYVSDLWLCTILALLSPIFSLLPTLLIKEVNQWVTNKVMSKSADNDVLQPGESSHCGSDR